jgi:chromosome transmission fidelity protein 1
MSLIMRCRETREALDLGLRNKIVIIDEAHNLLPAVNSSYSVTCAVETLHATSFLLAAYLNHFQTRLGVSKASTVTSLKNVSDRIAAFLSSLCGDAGGKDREGIFLPNAFLQECRLSNVNIPKLMHELREDHMIFKIAGYADTLEKAKPVKNTEALMPTFREKENKLNVGIPDQVKTYPISWHWT